MQRDCHNLFVFGVLGLLVAWTIKVAWQVIRAVELNVRLARGRALHLEAMSIYANDFQMLIRQHFNQILRMRRTVPSKEVPRLDLPAHVHPESITCQWTDERDAGGGPMGFGVEFVIDASVPCCVRLYWGVSAQSFNEFVQQRSQTTPEQFGRRPGPVSAAIALRNLRGRWTGRTACANPETTRSLLEMEELTSAAAPSSTETASTWTAPAATDAGEDPLLFHGTCFAQSRDFFLPAGCGQKYVTPAGDLIHPGVLTFDMGAAWLRPGQEQADQPAVVPLIIVVLASSGRSGRSDRTAETRGQISLVRFHPRTRNEGNAPYQSAEVIRQLCISEANLVFDVQGIFGFEDAGESDCMICYARPKNVVLLPCRHCSVCHSCLRSLRDEKCPLCRSNFSSYMTCPVSRGTAPARPQGPTGTQSDGRRSESRARPEDDSLAPLTQPDGQLDPGP